MRIQTYEALIGSKNRIVIPKAVRDYLHLESGDQLIWRITDDGQVWLLRGGTENAETERAVLVSQIHKEPAKY
jgi:AbrB family looped-hinge helix DNA binding protein